MSDDVVAHASEGRGDDTVRIVLADDHARVRAQVREALEAGGMEVCGEAATAEEAVALTLEQEPEVALLDIHMPGSGIAAAERIGRELPDAAVVMLTHSREEEDLFDEITHVEEEIRLRLSRWIMAMGSTAVWPACPYLYSSATTSWSRCPSTRHSCRQMAG